MKKVLTVLCLLGSLAGMTSCAANIILKAADSGNVGDVEKALTSGDDINARDNNGNTPLILAARHGDLAIVKKLFIKGADIRAKNADGYDALLALSNYTMIRSPLAAQRSQTSGPIPITTAGHLKTAEYLLNNGADINAKTNDGNTALILAAELNKKNLIDLLLDRGADVNATNLQGYSALLVASSKGYRDLICPLIRKGANKKLEDNEGKTALQYAQQNDRQEVIQLLNNPCPEEHSDMSIAPAQEKKGSDQLVDKLIESLTDQQPSVRWESARRLGEMKDSRAVVPLIGALSDNHAFVRRRAAVALGELHDVRGVDSLIKALHDSDPFVAKFAQEALEKITGQEFGNDSQKWTEWWDLKIRQY